MKAELISKLEELLLKDPNEVTNDVRTLQREYQKISLLELEKAKQKFVDEGGRIKEFEHSKQPEDTAFEELVKKYDKLKKENDAKAAAEQARNLVIREEIIAKIKDLSHMSENLGAAVRKLHELQTQWKETGPISSHKYKEVQAEYSRAVEDIYYNIKIFRDLQEHDLKKNLEMKTGLIAKLKSLHSLDNIKEAERLIKVYRNEWDEIGPVPNRKWDALKHEYKTVLEETYAKIKLYYTSLEELKENNLKAKRTLVEKTKELVDSLADIKGSKWNELTDNLLLLQSEWKQTGRAHEKENEKVWLEFRALCDSFFEQKKEFYSLLNEKFAAKRKLQSELIASAEALQQSTDWQKTTVELMKLQDTWKKQSAKKDKDAHKLFQRFQKACNTFFDAKRKHYESLDASYEQNLVNKEAILTRINEFKHSQDDAENRKALKAFVDEWNQAGNVPMKDKKRVNDAFYNRLDELYEQMHIDKNEKAKIQFNTKIERMLASENAYDLLLRESDHIRRLMDDINTRIRTYDNNIGFFKTSKGNSNIMQEIVEKIDAEKNNLNELNAKYKLINGELRKLQNTDKQKAAAQS